MEDRDRDTDVLEKGLLGLQVQNLFNSRSELIFVYKNDPSIEYLFLPYLCPFSPQSAVSRYDWTSESHENARRTRTECSRVRHNFYLFTFQPLSLLTNSTQSASLLQ
jgi:hypothetical protein